MEIKHLTKKIMVMLLLAFTGHTASAQLVEQVAAQAAQYAKALEKGKWEKVLDQTYLKIIEMNGGRAILLQKAIAAEKDMKQKGFSLVDAALAPPEPVVKSGDLLLCSVPMKLTFDGPYGKLFSESALLAVSENRGKTWRFIDLAQVPASTLSEIFPDLPPDLIIPPKRIYQE